jgi:hypothetical protein
MKLQCEIIENLVIIVGKNELKTDAKPRIQRISRKTLSIVVLILIAFILFEVYAHTYVQINHLPVLTRAEALRMIVPLYYNSTSTFSGDGASWLVALQYTKPLVPSPISYAYLFIFKTDQNNSLLAQNIDLLVTGLKLTSNGTSGDFYCRISDIEYESSYTVVAVQVYIS